jgi:hypothetical protein
MLLQNNRPFSRIIRHVSEISMCVNNARFNAAFIWFPSTNSARKYYVVNGHVDTYTCVYIY